MKYTELIKANPVQNKQRLLFFCIGLLAIFHFPVVIIESEYIGLFDFGLIAAYFICFLQYMYGQKFKLPVVWHDYLYAVIFYIGYLCFLTFLNPETYPIELFVKTIENNLFMLFLIIYMETHKNDMDFIIRTVEVLIFILVIYQIGHRFLHFPWELKRNWGRIGLPFTIGTASNPAGFVLGCYILTFGSFIFKFKTKKTFSIVVFVLVFISFVLTVSRTNMLAVMLVYILYYLSRIIRDAKALLLLITVSLFCVLIVYVMANYILPDYHYFDSMILILQNPSYILDDPSFQVRYLYFWPRAFDLWLSSPWTMLFGKGLGYYKTVDGTLPRLLSHQGLFGLFQFLYVWILYFLMRFRKNKWLKFFFLFVVFNSINAETLVTSYRTIQIYWLIFIPFIYAHEYLDKHRIHEIPEK